MSRVPHIEAACDLARRHGATVEVDMKGRGRHPMLRVLFNDASELITVSLTPGKTYALDYVLGDVKRALRKLGAIKSNGPGERRRRKRRHRSDPRVYRRKPTPVSRSFRDQLRDWRFHNMRQAS
ncbi:MAG: hypothetical protein ACREML_04545 [Vulcanimicrobiaceae bacterium]